MSHAPSAILATLLVVLAGAPAHAATAPQVVASFGFCTGCSLPVFGSETAPVSVPGEVVAPNSGGYNKFSFTGSTIELSMNGAFATGFCCVNPIEYPGHNFNGWRLQFGPGVEVTGAQLTAFAPGGLTPEVSWTADSVYLNMWGAQLHIDHPVTLSYATTAAPVPEPARLALWMAGLAAMGLESMRRRRG